LTVVEATHTNGESNFQVSLVGGEFDDLFVNAIGEYDGETAALIDEGEYTLDVEADGDWEVEIRQPRAASGDSLPQSLEGDTPKSMDHSSSMGATSLPGATAARRISKSTCTPQRGVSASSYSTKLDSTTVRRRFATRALDG